MPSYTETRVKPALERDVNIFYDMLYAAADTRQKKRVYEGYPSKLFKQLELNPRYYTPIRKILVDTGSIEIVERGNRAKPSVWVLNHKPPPQESWPKGLTGEAVSATLRGEFERRITALEAWRENLTGGGKANILEILLDFEQRIAKLEKAVDIKPTASRKVGK
jgi:hypothetical protein